MPLGLLIEQRDDGTIVVDGALPGYSSFGNVEVGDRVRAVSAYVEVLGNAPMWQQLASYTPVGTPELKRLIFRTEGATYRNVRDAIASHREGEGGNGVVSLLLERPLNATTPMAPRDVSPAALEPLADVIRRDVQQKYVGKDVASQLDALSPAERARRLLGGDDEDS